MRINSINKTPVITLKNVIKKYTFHHDKPTISDLFLAPKRGEFVYALKGCNLQIFQGEKVGIIGANGSGKTTLLKIIQQISTPNSGSVEVVGKVVSLIDVAAGFHPDLSGIDNVYVNGMMLGLSKKEIVKLMPAITAFAELGKFIKAPFYTYSEGMKLRLGFSIAAHARFDTILLDENFIVEVAR